MLEECAPGHVRKETTHYWRVTYQGETYPSLPRGRHGPSLPRGRHGKRANPSIEVGHIRQMTRQLGILDCAKEQLSVV